MQNSEFRQGIIYALLAYGLWGLAPLYFKLIDQVPVAEILMHRVLWSFVLLLGLVLLARQWPQVVDVLKRPKRLALTVVTSVLIGLNWSVFIWAISNDRLLEASLGYFINPLLSVALGMFFLKERLSNMQLFAVGLAATGVVIQLMVFGSIPWVALCLAISFGFYGLFKKQIKLKAVTGLFIETAMLAPVALWYWLQIEHSATSSFADNDLSLNISLLCAGIVTTLPLLAFAGAAVRIPLYLLGLFQYIGPSMMFVMAIALFGESLDAAKLSTFVFIWLALAVFVLDMWRAKSRARVVVKS